DGGAGQRVGQLLRDARGRDDDFLRGIVPGLRERGRGGQQRQRGDDGGEGERRDAAVRGRDRPGVARLHGSTRIFNRGTSVPAGATKTIARRSTRGRSRTAGRYPGWRRGSVPKAFPRAL